MFPKLRSLSLEVDEPTRDGLLDCSAFGQLACLETLAVRGWEDVKLTRDMLLPGLTFLSVQEVSAFQADVALPSLQRLRLADIATVQLGADSLQLPQLTQLQVYDVHRDLRINWAAMPQLAELALEDVDALTADFAGLAELAQITSLSVVYASNDSGRAADRVLTAVQPTVRSLSILGGRDDWSEPPPLASLFQVTNLICHGVSLLPHLAPLRQLCRLEIMAASATDLTLEHIECLSSMTSLQKLRFGGGMWLRGQGRLRLQVRLLVIIVFLERPAFGRGRPCTGF